MSRCTVLITFGYTAYLLRAPVFTPSFLVEVVFLVILVLCVVGFFIQNTAHQVLFNECCSGIFSKNLPNLRVINSRFI